MKSDPLSLPQERHQVLRPWWQEAVFYQILVDRFCRAGGGGPLHDPSLPLFCGGNLQGVIERLDYLRRLGVSALWLSPIQCTADYHGYHITDYGRIEPRFGGMTAFRALLRASKPDIRLIMDWVPNHVHDSHPFFQEALHRKNSRYRGWFYFDRQGNYLRFLDVACLPKLNLDHPEARRFMIECALQWLDLGVDGFRLDHVLGPSLGFWRDFRDAVKRHKPSAYLVGEALFMGIRRKHLNTLRLPRKYLYFQQTRQGLSVADPVIKEYAGILDGLLDFKFQEILKNEVAHAERRPSIRRVQSLLDAHYEAFPATLSLPSFLDNHDMNRFLFEARGNKGRLKQAAEIQFRQEQPPIIYYGTEAGMSQTNAVEGMHGDLRARQLMPWENPDKELLRFYTELISQRKSRRAKMDSLVAPP
jgi:glycosidase